MTKHRLLVCNWGTNQTSEKLLQIFQKKHSTLVINDPKPPLSELEQQDIDLTFFILPDDNQKKELIDSMLDILKPASSIGVYRPESNTEAYPFHLFDEIIFEPLFASKVRYHLQKCLDPSLLEKEQTKKALRNQMRERFLIGQDPAFVKVMKQIELVAQSESTVLIQGETGVGKELCARAIHYNSPRASFPFVPVECGSIPVHLMENELFGHQKGAFTDARESQKGLVAEAENGTLLLDEIDSLSLEAQSKLLRLLENRTYRPIGKTSPLEANIRIITATNQNLYSKVKQGQFRKDLFFRLGVVIQIPPLRDRTSDIPILAETFLTRHCERAETEKRLSKTAMNKLMQYEWPGNVRELDNVIQQAILLSTRSIISAEDIYIHDTENLSLAEANRVEPRV